MEPIRMHSTIKHMKKARRGQRLFQVLISEQGLSDVYALEILNTSGVKEMLPASH